MNMKVSDLVGEVTESIKVTSRTYFSIQHIRSAALLSRLSAKIEGDYSGKFSDELYAEHITYVMNTIFSAVAFLETTINELFQDAAENEDAHIKPLNSDIKETMANIWKCGLLERTPILEKFQIALMRAKKQQFDKGSAPYQDVYLLIQLRNALLHYKPEYITHGETVHNFEKKLKGKFSLSPIKGKRNPFWPGKCLGHGCAKWVVISCIKFADEFYLRMGLNPTFNHIRSHLKTE